MPHTFDLSQDQLQSYQGRNPRPTDFDAYWQRGLDDIAAVDPDVEIVPADFQTPFAECSHLYFTGTGGARIHAKLIRPKTTTPGPAVLFFHGYTMNGGSWNGHLACAAAGITVLAMDCRGQGGLSQDVGGHNGFTVEGHIIRGLQDALNGNPDNLLFRHIFLDTVQLARVASELPFVDASRMAATGASQGGGLTVACAALVPSIKLALPVYPFLTDYLRVWEMDLMGEGYGEIRTWFKRFDPRHQQNEAVFTQLGYIDVQHLASRIEAEVDWFIGYEDMICPPSTQFATYNKITSPKKLFEYHNFDHSYLPLSDDLIFQRLLTL